MSDNYTVLVTTSLLTGTTTDQSKTATADEALTESFWAQVQLPAGASDTTLSLHLQTDPKVLVVYGATGVTFKLGAAGADAIGADPVAVVGNEGDGLDISSILLSNGDSAEHSVTVIAFE